MGWMVKVEYEPEHEVIEESYLCRIVGDLDAVVPELVKRLRARRA